MTGPVFVDTNVFVYRHDASEPAKQPRALQWIALLAGRRAGRAFGCFRSCTRP